MSARISGIGMPDRHSMAAAVDLDASHVKDTQSAESARTKQMAQEFEAMFLRQILTAAKIGGAAKSGGGGDGYQSMSVDALASTISKSGGMGLAKQIEDLVGHAQRPILDTTLEQPSSAASAEVPGAVPTPSSK